MDTRVRGDPIGLWSDFHKGPFGRCIKDELTLRETEREQFVCPACGRDAAEVLRNAAQHR